ncbi:hypothetical protein A9Q99_24995 [Gammaproteobacteria bacterium 45_16_T64]|nr:hypothetical protein A9Q99_24995 [Gammaproteobacteria bacterium 45_16_T64]
MFMTVEEAIVMKVKAVVKRGVHIVLLGSFPASDYHNPIVQRQPASIFQRGYIAQDITAY